MTTSLTASPLLPIATAGVAAALILGTLSSSPTAANADLAAADDTPVAADPYAAGAPEVPAATGKIVKKCTATACTITFPAEGGSVKGLGTTITATKFYGDGITLTIGATELVANLATPAKGGGYTLTIVSVASGAQSAHTVKITKK